MKFANYIKFFSLLVLICAFASSRQVKAEVVWKISSDRTRVSFKVSHFVLMSVEGRFRNPEGQLVSRNEADFSGGVLEASVPVSTIDTGNGDRDAHLKQAVFFDSEKYPKMNFRSKSITKFSETEYEMLGNLTIRNISLPVVFKVESRGESVSKTGITRSKFVARGTVDRYKFGLKWNEFTEAGAMVVGENVDIEMDVTLEKIPSTLASK